MIKLLFALLILSEGIQAQDTQLQLIANNFYTKYKNHTYYCPQIYTHEQKTCMPLKSLTVKLESIPNPYASIVKFDDGNLSVSFSDTRLNKNTILFEMDSLAKTLEKYE
jgi:hypothetical protein